MKISPFQAQAPPTVIPGENNKIRSLSASKSFQQAVFSDSPGSRSCTDSSLAPYSFGRSLSGASTMTALILYTPSWPYYGCSTDTRAEIHSQLFQITLIYLNVDSLAVIFSANKDKRKFVENTVPHSPYCDKALSE